jgi:hypothetical protein
MKAWLIKPEASRAVGSKNHVQDGCGVNLQTALA